MSCTPFLNSWFSLCHVNAQPRKLIQAEHLSHCSWEALRSQQQMPFTGLAAFLFGVLDPLKHHQGPADRHIVSGLWALLSCKFSVLLWTTPASTCFVQTTAAVGSVFPYFGEVSWRVVWHWWRMLDSSKETHRSFCVQVQRKPLDCRIWSSFTMDPWLQDSLWSTEQIIWGQCWSVTCLDTMTEKRKSKQLWESSFGLLFS